MSKLNLNQSLYINLMESFSCPGVGITFGVPGGGVNFLRGKVVIASGQFLNSCCLRICPYEGEELGNRIVELWQSCSTYFPTILAFDDIELLSIGGHIMEWWGGGPQLFECVSNHKGEQILHHFSTLTGKEGYWQRPTKQIAPIL